MNPERHRRIGEIYHAALEQAPAARERFVTDACGDDAELRSDVLALLAAHDDAEHFLSAPALHHAAVTLAETRSPAPVDAGPYRIEAVLGRGGMGEVYLAQDSRLGRKVALKILPAQFTANPDSVRRFEQEARAASSLNHPNIVSIFDIGQSSSGRFLVMELVEGETLRQPPGRTLPIQDIVRIGAQIAEALNVAHAAGIVHRDIKPENVMVRADGYVKVLDFGLARLLAHPSPDDAKVATHPGTILGTPRYMSPEQARGLPGGTASDIFSLGAVLYELAAGQPAFDGDTSVAIMHAILAHQPVTLSQLNPAMPAAIDALVTSMLSKDERVRPSAAEVVAALPAIARGASASPARPAPTVEAHSVGRERDVDRLNTALDAAAAGRGQVICVSGEPGIGKTTLVESFLASLDRDEPSYFVARGRCSERLAGTEAYLPWLEALDGLRQTSGGSADRLLQTLAPSWHRQLSRAAADAQTQEGSQERMKRELARFVQELCRTRPLVLFFDDVHWADASTIDLLGYISMRFDTLRMLVVVAYRPTDMALARHPFLQLKPELQHRGCCRDLPLELLTREDVDRYLTLEFPGHRLAPTLAALIHHKTEGNPLFMVDLVRYLRDRGVIGVEDGVARLAQSLPWVEQDLPESIRGMIERKVSQLGEEDRRLLTAAAVQGFEFDSFVLARAIGLDQAAVEERLEALASVHAFIALTGERDLPSGAVSLNCRFVHVLYQNAFYASLGPARRTQISLSVGHALMEAFERQLGAVASQLARLFESGRDWSRASAHYLSAAQNAARLFAYQETITLAQRGLELVRRLPDSVEHRRRELDCQLVLISALIVVKGYGSTEAVDACLRARELCEQVDDYQSLYMALVNLAIIRSMRGEGDAARELMEQCLELATRAQDDGRIMIAHELLGETYWGRGMFRESRAHFEASAALYEPSRDFALAVLNVGNDLGVACKVVCAHSVWYLGYPDRALVWSQEGVALSRQLSHPWSSAFAWCHTALLRVYRRDYAEALEAADIGLAISRENEFEMWTGYTLLLRGRALAEQGRHAEGIELIREGIHLYRKGGNELEYPLFAALLGEVFLMADRIEDGLAIVDDGLDQAECNGIRVHEPELHRLKGELLLKNGDSSDESRAAHAMACFERAAAMAREQEAKSLELRAAMSLARLYQRQGRAHEASDLVRPIYEWFAEGLETQDLKDARAMLTLTV
jgi:tetratricopeptide (TPR) repeat protein